MVTILFPQTIFIILGLLFRVNAFSSSRLPSLNRYGETCLFVYPSRKANALKKELLGKLTEFQELQERDGKVSVDFGVKGGELNQTSRAPQKIDYYSVSDDVGKAADAIIELCQDKLAMCSPIENPTKFLGDKRNGQKSPLHGPWKLLFTTAADASFSSNSTRGEAAVQNIVDGPRGRITNVIDFLPSKNGTKPLLKQLNVVIKAKAENERRVKLSFRYAKAVFSRFFRWNVQWSLYIPVPATFITRVIVLLYRIFRKKKAQKPPLAYFDVLYLDDDLRIHKTGEDNLFVQARPSWKEAANLII